MTDATQLSIVGDEAPAATGTNSVRFGVILDLNGTQVPISSGDVANALKNGVEFTLQNPIDLGSIDKFETWVSGQFGVSLPTAASLPTPLDQVVGAITGMEITVEKAHLKVPGSNDKSGVKYTIEVNGTFQPEIPLVSDKLQIQGMVFGFSNEDTTA